MLPFGVTFPATVPQRSEIPEGLMNYPVCCAECKSWRSSLRNQLHSPVTSTILGPNIFLTTLSRISSGCVPPSMWEAKFHTHAKQTCKIIPWVSQLLYFWKARRKTKYSATNNSNHFLTSICSQFLHKRDYTLRLSAKNLKFSISSYDLLPFFMLRFWPALSIASPIR